MQLSDGKWHPLYRVLIPKTYAPNKIILILESTGFKGIIITT